MTSLVLTGLFENPTEFRLIDFESVPSIDLFILIVFGSLNPSVNISKSSTMFIPVIIFDWLKLSSLFFLKVKMSPF